MRASINAIAALSAVLVFLFAQTATSHPPSNRLFPQDLNQTSTLHCYSYPYPTGLAESLGDLLLPQLNSGPAPTAGALWFTPNVCAHSGGALIVTATTEWFALLMWSTPLQSAPARAGVEESLKPHIGKREPLSTNLYLGVVRNDRIFTTSEQPGRADYGWRYALSAGISRDLPQSPFGEAEEDELTEDKPSSLFSSLVLKGQLIYHF